MLEGCGEAIFCPAQFHWTRFNEPRVSRHCGYTIYYIPALELTRKEEEAAAEEELVARATFDKDYYPVGESDEKVSFDTSDGRLLPIYIRRTESKIYIVDSFLVYSLVTYSRVFLEKI